MHLQQKKASKFHSSEKLLDHSSWIALKKEHQIKLSLRRDKHSWRIEAVGWTSWQHPWSKRAHRRTNLRSDEKELLPALKLPDWETNPTIFRCDMHKLIGYFKNSWQIKRSLPFTYCIEKFLEHNFLFIKGKLSPIRSKNKTWLRNYIHFQQLLFVCLFRFHKFSTFVE